METTYLGVVLTDYLSCAKDFERAKLAFFKQFNFIYHKFSFNDKKVFFICFDNMQCRFIVLEPGI